MGLCTSRYGACARQQTPKAGDNEENLASDDSDFGIADVAISHAAELGLGDGLVDLKEQQKSWGLEVDTRIPTPPSRTPTKCVAISKAAKEVQKTPHLDNDSVSTWLACAGIDS